MNQDIKLFFLFLILGLTALAFSIWASSWPDGLETAAQKFGFEKQPFVLVKGLMPDYLFPALENEKWAGLLAGFSGAIMVFLTLGVLLYFLRKIYQ